MNTKKKPKFCRTGQVSKRMGRKWRKPRGTDNKQRKYWKSKPRHPKAGYSADKSIRFLHPSGFEDVLVTCISDLRDLDPEKQAVRIGGTIGKKKRIMMLKEAEKLKLKVLNPGNQESKK